MANFIGEYSAKIDDKGRIVFPAPFKAILALEGEKLLVVKKDLFTECLELFTYHQWEKESEKVKERLNFFNKEHAAFWREYMRDRAIVEPDEKLGRISIPKQLLAQIGVNKELVFVGNDHKIEIWNKENYQTQQINKEEFVALAQKILG